QRPRQFLDLRRQGPEAVDREVGSSVVDDYDEQVHGTRSLSSLAVGWATRALGRPFIAARARSAATLRARNAALRAYLGASRRGSSAIRKAHSIPIRCTNGGARLTRSAAKSIDAPTLTTTGTPRRS